MKQSLPVVYSYVLPEIIQVPDSLCLPKLIENRHPLSVPIEQEPKRRRKEDDYDKYKSDCNQRPQGGSSPIEKRIDKSHRDHVLILSFRIRRFGDGPIRTRIYGDLESEPPYREMLRRIHVEESTPRRVGSFSQFQR